MAKEQELSLASSKISGVCGRLMCCLSYEYNFYQDEKKKYPELDSKIKIKDTIGRVKSINILRKKITLELEDGTVKEYNLAEVCGQKCPHKEPGK